jgi:hypothetical protein
MLDLANVVVVSLSQAPAGLNSFQPNNVAMFTKEQPGVAFDYKVYLSPSEVVKDFGTYSETSAMAAAIFAQNPNILNGSGKLIIVPMQASVSIPATHGTLTTIDILGNLTNFKAIDDGEFDLAIDGASAVHITGCDFTAIEDISDVAAVIDAKLTGASCEAIDGTLVVKSDSTGATSAIAISKYSAGTGTDITVVSFMDVADAVIVAGVAAYSGAETPLLAIVRTQESLNYVGILLQGVTDEDDMEDASDYVQSLNKMLFLVRVSETSMNSGELFYLIKSKSNNHTRMFLYKYGTAQDASKALASYVGRAMSTDFTGSQTTQTMHMKDLSTVVADEAIDQTILEKCKQVGVDIYGAFQGLGKVFSTGANKFFDQVYNLIWMIETLKIAGFNAIATTSSKIPQTEGGVDILKSYYRRVCEQAVTNGYIAPGTWTSPDRFGNAADFMRNISEKGYYIYSQPVSEQLPEDRKLRKAPLIQIAFKESGAIHSTNVIVNVEA